MLFRNNLRLKPSILTAFVFLTIPVFFTIIAVNYFSNDSIARSDAKQLIERFRIDALENIEDDFNPLKSLIRSAAAIGDQYPDFYADNRCFAYFYSILIHSPKIVSVYVGLRDGSFRQTRRVDPAATIQDKPPPEGARYAYRWVVPKAGSPTLDRYVFLDAKQKELGSTEQPTTYDPRPRLWYRSAVEAGTIMISDPDIFAAQGLIGFTVAAPFYADGKLLGVAAADITLDDLGAYLGERKVSPGTLSYILDHEGRVIAASDLSQTYDRTDGKLELRHITSLDNPLAAIAFGARPRVSEGMFSFRHDGHEYVASISGLAAEFGKKWQLFTITPLSDFTGPYLANNERMVIFGLLAVALQILIIYFLSSVISAPLEKLAFKVGRIQQLGSEQLPSVSSPIREIFV
ncbi:MAG TPA: cache domain-containing protein, partial [Reyranella sp.]|nr:cache domain-containing protein [Reyranella sp.]